MGKEEEIVSKLSKLDQVLIQFPGKHTETKVLKHLQKDKTIITRPEQRNIKESTTRVQWCDFYKTSSHDQSRYRRKVQAHRQENENTKGDKKENTRAYLIIEPTKEVEGIKLKGEIKGTVLQQLLTLELEQIISVKNLHKN